MSDLSRRLIAVMLDLGAGVMDSRGHGYWEHFCDGELVEMEEEFDKEIAEYLKDKANRMKLADESHAILASQRPDQDRGEEDGS